MLSAHGQAWHTPEPSTPTLQPPPPLDCDNYPSNTCYPATADRSTRPQCGQIGATETGATTRPRQEPRPLRSRSGSQTLREGVADIYALTHALIC